MNLTSTHRRSGARWLKTAALRRILAVCSSAVLVLIQPAQAVLPQSSSVVQHYEYVFPDGRMYVYDMDYNHQMVKTIELPTTAGVRGVVGNAQDHALYISYGSDHEAGQLLKLDLLTDSVVWQSSYSFGIDSHAISPDGKTIYMPAGENSPGPYWYLINASDGSQTGNRIEGGPGPHNTLVSLNGQHVYMGARNFADRPTYLTVADVASGNVRRIGPFLQGVRPFTINSAETLAYVTTTGFLGFQVADIPSGKILFTVDLTQMGFPNPGGGPSAPSHGIALSPDEREVVVVDWPNDAVHFFNVEGVPISPPRKVADVKFTRSMHHHESPCAYDCLADGWLQYSRDGRFVYVGDEGDVIDAASKQVVANLDALYNSRKMLEVDWTDGVPSFVPNNRASVGYSGSG
jgi:DNA-binding beta-propeller fold protein YncE